MRRTVLVALPLMLLLVTVGSTACDPEETVCGHRASIINEVYYVTYTDPTAAEARNHGSWATSDDDGTCEGLAVFYMHTSGGSYWNSCHWDHAQRSTDVESCVLEVINREDRVWAHLNIDGYFSWVNVDSTRYYYAAKTTIYMHKDNDNPALDCSISGSRPSGTVTACERDYVFEGPIS